MIEVATASINSFAPVASQADVSPIEEPVFILTASQLQDLIQEAIERATTPLESRIESLERKVGSGEGGEDAPDSQKWHDNLLQIVLDLRANMALKRELEALQEIMPWVEALSKKIARLQAQVEAQEKKPQPLQKDRGEILRALIAANGGKMLAKDARKKMHLTKPLFSMLLASMGDGVDIKPLHSDKRKRVLTLK
jgi:chaperonin cofactor prefoldin